MGYSSDFFSQKVFSSNENLYFKPYEPNYAYEQALGIIPQSGMLPHIGYTPGHYNPYPSIEGMHHQPWRTPSTPYYEPEAPNLGWLKGVGAAVGLTAAAIVAKKAGAFKNLGKFFNKNFFKKATQETSNKANDLTKKVIELGMGKPTTADIVDDVTQEVVHQNGVRALKEPAKGKRAQKAAERVTELPSGKNTIELPETTGKPVLGPIENYIDGAPKQNSIKPPVKQPMTDDAAKDIPPQNGMLGLKEPAKGKRAQKAAERVTELPSGDKIIIMSEKAGDAVPHQELTPERAKGINKLLNHINKMQEQVKGWAIWERLGKNK